MGKDIVVTSILIMMVTIVSGSLLIIGDSLSHSALGLIEGTE